MREKESERGWERREGVRGRESTGRQELEIDNTSE
jgi:hypothetical protein